ncbi:hypothetical protein CEXT_68841 [Caerostris extrusa]|uniref:Uncharacterized protein n=1 Tax=Caerostris extrusa TaxID=172846 RepID=A0AAV4TCT6_CAEEX|nr:hypothetical protein CEXT_68841 [Caerostris extrusa]
MPPENRHCYAFPNPDSLTMKRPILSKRFYQSFIIIIGSARELKLPVIRKERPMIYTFGRNEGIVVKEFDVYQLLIRSPRNPHTSSEIEVLTTDLISGIFSSRFHPNVRRFENLWNNGVGPLVSISSNPEDLNPPGHFIIETALNVIPELNWISDKIILTLFSHVSGNIEENLPPLKWRLGGIIELCPGADGEESAACQSNLCLVTVTTEVECKAGGPLEGGTV